MEKPASNNNIRRRGEFTALAVLCLVAGLLLTLDNIGIIEGIWRVWPIFPFFLGLGGIWWFSKRKEKSDPLSCGIGTFLILVSIFFFILNFAGWALMSKLWPTFIGISGISIVVSSLFAEQRRWFAVSGLFFIFLSVIFFMVFTVDARLWPVSLMLFGIWLLFLPRGGKGEK